MCGIAGIFHREIAKPVEPQRVAAMTEALAHRGPDGSGIWTRPGIGLGHRRLAIIDLSSGADQPMQSADGRHTIVFNGEIYNYRELRDELIGLGHAFRTAGDTEVILQAWQRWGAGAIARLNGMFAFAIHDAAEETLTLVRDRVGVKPLFYAELSDGALLFASELKGILAHPRFRAAPNPLAIDDFLGLGYVPDDSCIVDGVTKLPAGCWLTIRRGQPLPRPQRWWELSFADRLTGSIAELEEGLVARMRDAVRSRMVSDVPLGAFLSGGLDSSAVVALMAEASPAAVETCSIGFDVADHDETQYAKIVADRFATAHRTRTVAAADFGLIDTLAQVFDEPFADASALATYRVCELAREKVTVALSGDGADEALAGYRRYVFQHNEERVRGVLSPAARANVFGTLGRIYPKADWAPQRFRAKATLLALAGSGEEAYAAAVSYTRPELRRRLYTPALAQAVGGHRAEHRYIDAMRAAPARDPIDRAQWADMKIWLPGDILTKVDRTSMAVSLEAREPLLDHRLLEYCARLPVEMRVRAGSGKWLMKRAMRRHLPEEIIDRRKMGFVTPISAWFRGPLADEATAIATGSALARSGWFDLDAIAGVVREHRSGRSDHGRLLWQLLMLDRSIGRLFGLA